MHNHEKLSLKEIPFSVIKRILLYIFNEYKFRLLLVLIFLIISSITSIYGITLIGKVIDEGIAPFINSNYDFSVLANIIIEMVCVFFLSTISIFLSNYLLIEVTEGTLKKIRDDMFINMQKFPVSYFDKNSYGDIMSKYTNDTDTISQMISNSIPTIASSLLSSVVILIFMLRISPLLTFFVLIFIVFMFFVTSIVSKYSTRYFSRHQETIGEINAYIEEMISGVKVIKVFNQEEKNIEDFNKINEDVCNYSTKAHLISNTFMPIMAQLGNLQYAFIAIFGGLMAINKPEYISVGMVIVFLTLTKNFRSYITQASNQMNFITKAVAGLKRIFELMDEEPEVDNGKYILVEKKKYIFPLFRSSEICYFKNRDDLVQIKGDVRFNNVSFSYDKEKNILENLSFYAKPGQKIAFVGSTGAGKTTIINLINRFYDVDDGYITFDGIDIRDIKKYDLRKSIGFVLQDVILFSGTIYDNICYGNQKSTKKDVIKAARLAGAHNFIKMLPKGYDTVISNNGSELSEGQKQLISIARALLLKPPVLILDEATSSIDSRTEKIVQDGMDKLMEGRTVFIIAHRLSTVRNANCIVVLENGKIIEKGTHDELVKLKGKYYELSKGKIELE